MANPQDTASGGARSCPNSKRGAPICNVLQQAGPQPKLLPHISRPYRWKDFAPRECARGRLPHNCLKPRLSGQSFAASAYPIG